MYRQGTVTVPLSRGTNRVCPVHGDKNGPRFPEITLLSSTFKNYPSILLSTVKHNEVTFGYGESFCKSYWSYKVGTSSEHMQPDKSTFNTVPTTRNGSKFHHCLFLCGCSPVYWTLDLIKLTQSLNLGLHWYPRYSPFLHLISEFTSNIRKHWSLPRLHVNDRSKGYPI